MSLTFHLATLPLLIRIGLTDWLSRRIHNSDLFALVLLTGAYGWAADIGMARLTVSCAAGLALTLPGFLLGAIGGGDIKLMCALAPLWPPQTLLGIFATGVAITWTLLRISKKAAADTPTLPLGSAMLLGTGCWLVIRVVEHA